MIDASQLRNDIVRPALEDTGMWSLDAENLVMGTAAQESRLKYIRQLGDGPALSLFQMEPATYKDIWDNYLSYREDLSETILNAIDASGIPPATRLMWDLRFSAIMCRVHYRRVQEPLPTDLPGMAQYWKDHYNTVLGAGTVEEFIENYHLVE